MFSVLKKSIRYYSESLSSALGFGLLLVFVLFFLAFPKSFISSGTVFLNYLALESLSFETVLLLLGVLVFLFFYSVFVVLMVFSVRNYLSSVKLNYYVTDKIRKFAIKYFVFLAAMSAISIALVFVLSFIPGGKILAFLLLLVVFFFSFFLPQAIVVDEESLSSSMQNNLDFSMRHLPQVFFIFGLSLGFFYILSIVEYALNMFYFPGEFLSLVLMIMFVVPLLEAVKTAFYMEKFGLVKRTSLA